MNKFNKRIF